MINSQVINRWCFWELSREESFKQIWSVVFATNQITLHLGWLLCLFLIRYEHECVFTPRYVTTGCTKNDSAQSNLVNQWVCKCSSQEYRWAVVYTFICDWKAAPGGKSQLYIHGGKFMKVASLAQLAGLSTGEQVSSTQKSLFVTLEMVFLIICKI